MNLINQIEDFARTIPADFKEKNGAGQFTFVVAERKAFLSSQKLVYEAKFKLDEKEKSLRFTEALKESSSGMSAGGLEISSNNYRTGKGGQQESVFEHQSWLFGKKYDFSFDFKSVREKIELLAREAGYEFKYQITA